MRSQHTGMVRIGTRTARQLWRALLTAAALVIALSVMTRPSAAQPAASAPAATAGVTAHTVTYDGYSFKIDGKRVYIWSGEFHYFRLPSPDLWLDIFQKMKAAGFNAVSLYFDWDYHSPAPGVYDFTGVRDLDKLLDEAQEAGLYVIARPAPYINAEVDSGGLPGWLTTKQENNRSADPNFLKYSDEWMTQIDRILARHQLTNGTGPVIAYQVENEYYNGSAAGRAYMQHLEDKARADGITVPLTGNNNGTFNSGVGALNVDGPDSYPQGFNCSNPAKWNGVPNISYDHPAGNPLYSPEFQGGAFDPWGGPGYDKCAQLINDQFADVFYKQNIAVGATAQSFYMTYGGTNWGWLGQPENYTSYDYGAAIRETRQLDPKYYEDKLIGYMTQSVAPLTKTDRINVTPPDNTAIVDTARMNPDTKTQFHVLRHSNSTSTSVDQTHISIDFNAQPVTNVSYTYDDTDIPPLQYAGTGWSHVANQSYTGGDYKNTESFSNTAGDSLTVPFTGTAIRWIGSQTGNHGFADVYLDGVKQATVDCSGSQSQAVLFSRAGLTDGPHTLKIVVDGSHASGSTDNFVSIDAIDVPTGAAAANPTYPVVPQQPGTAITLNGRDSHIIVADYKLGDSQLQYSTSEIMTNATIGGRDIAVLYGDQGSDGETVLNYSSRPTVQATGGAVTTTWDAATGDLRLNYQHNGLIRVLISGDGSRPLLLLLADKATGHRGRPGAGARYAPAAHRDEQPGWQHGRAHRRQRQRPEHRGLHVRVGRYLERQDRAHVTDEHRQPDRHDRDRRGDHAARAHHLEARGGIAGVAARLRRLKLAGRRQDDHQQFQRRQHPPGAVRRRLRLPHRQHLVPRPVPRERQGDRNPPGLRLGRGSTGVLGVAERNVPRQLHDGQRRLHVPGRDTEVDR
jgi:beta-galactosidase GanA